MKFSELNMLDVFKHPGVDTRCIKVSEEDYIFLTGCITHPTSDTAEVIKCGRMIFLADQKDSS